MLDKHAQLWLTDVCAHEADPSKSEASSSQGQLQEVHHPALAARHHRHALAGQPGKLAAGEPGVRHEEAVNSPCNADKDFATWPCQVLLRYRSLQGSLLCKISRV